MRVLITRPEPDATRFANEIASIGFEPVVHPFLVYTPLVFDPALLSKAKAIAITSGNALRALKDLRAPAEVSKLPAYIVGEETARKARAFGISNVVAVAPRAEALSGLIADRFRESGPVLHLTGVHRGFNLTGSLQKAGVEASAVPIYRMDAIRAFDAHLLDLFEKGAMEAVVLMSPRTASIYTALCERDAPFSRTPGIGFFCLSGNIAACLAMPQPSKVFIASEPTKRALIALMTRVRSAIAQPRLHDTLPLTKNHRVFQ